MTIWTNVLRLYLDRVIIRTCNPGVGEDRYSCITRPESMAQASSLYFTTMET